MRRRPLHLLEGTAWGFKGPEEIKRLAILVRSKLTNYLRRAPWKGNPNKMAGHCYVASEALFFLLGGKQAGWKPIYLKVGGESHWFLKHKSGLVLDATEDQFCQLVDHAKGKGKGFSTPGAVPAKRAKTVMNSVLSSPQGEEIVKAARSVV